MTASARELASGTRLGMYEILRKLATGGMAEIYLASVRGNFDFEKLVVLKMILPHVADDPTFVQMFLDEARLAATLHHPNIAQVYDCGEAAGTYFFAMEYVHGEDARTVRHAARRAGAPVPCEHALAIIHATASALHYAHERTGPNGPLNVVHRDVSPSNILISYDGAVKLVDFGIARASHRTSKTRTGTLKGKIPYMSPEQCRGTPTDRRSDLFSLGTVLFELTVGRRPFRGDNDFAVLEQIVNGHAPLPSTIVPGYPKALEHIVMRLLARDPDRRYQDGEELLIDLEAFIADQNIRVSPITLGRYVRALFADKIAAWERAEAEGTTLGEHVAEHATSPSQRAELVTPPSAWPVPLLPTVVDDGSSGILVKPPPMPKPDTSKRISKPLHAVALQIPSSLLGTPEPAAKKKGGGLALALLVALVMGGAGLGVGLWMGQEREKERATAPAPQGPPSAAVPTVPPPAPAPAAVVDAAPAVVTTTTDAAPAVTTTADAAPAPAPPPELPKVTATAKKKPAPPVRPKVLPKRQPKHPPKPEPDKEETWDRDSPFLPQ